MPCEWNRGPEGGVTHSLVRQKIDVLGVSCQGDLRSKGGVTHYPGRILMLAECPVRVIKVQAERSLTSHVDS